MISKKICLVGAFAVGKTSLVSRFVHSLFSEKYHSTIGVKIDKKTVTIDDKTVNLILWDMAGEEEYVKLQTSYLRGASGYLLVLDGTRAETLSIAKDIVDKVDATSSNIPFVAVINKHDLADSWQIGAEDIESLRQAGWSVIYSSAKTGEGVESAFELLTQKLLA
jgi:hypothetical protein